MATVRIRVAKASVGRMYVVTKRGLRIEGWRPTYGWAKRVAVRKARKLGDGAHEVLEA